MRRRKSQKAGKVKAFKAQKVSLFLWALYSLLLFAIFSAFAAPSALAATYYIDSAAGSNSNNGTSTSTPWKTVAKVNGSSFLAGDQILFKRGGTWNETLNVPASGASGNPLVFGAYGTGTDPIFDEQGVRTNAVVSNAKSYITIQDIQMQNSGDALISVTNSVNCIIQRNTLRNAATHGIQFAGSQNIGVQVLNNTIQDDPGRPAGGTGVLCSSGSQCDGAIIEGNTITRAGDVRKSGVILFDSSNVAIRYNTVTYNAIGFQLHTAYKAITGSAIYGNSIINTKNGDAEGIELTGCTDALGKYSESKCLSASDDTFLVTADVYNNFCSNPNTSSANDCIGGVLTSNLRIYNNVIIGPAQFGVHVTKGEAEISFGCDGTLMYNNSVYGVQVGLSPDGCRNAVMRNNIISTSPVGAATGNGGACVESHNTYFNTARDTIGAPACLSQGNLLTSDPRFAVVRPTAAAHFKLQPGSPAIDTGMSLGAPFQTAALDPTDTTFPYATVNQGSYGSGWERGAFAFLSPAASPCDVNQDGITNVMDVQGIVNQALGATCKNDVDHDGKCTIADVQKVINAALGGTCGAN